MTVATTSAPGTITPVETSVSERTWPLYAVCFASLSIVVGLIWDISWHRTIGRDTFWSPPHVLEQVAALITGLSCGWLVLHTTLRGTPEEHARSVRFWGFRGPLGAWICIWGTIMMITSAPFDDWWHNAYGLDVKILSPPHMVLAWGMIAIQVGAMVMALARQNRASPSEYSRLVAVYLCSAAIMLTMHATVMIEYAAFPNHMHGSLFYRMTAIGGPAILVATARPTRLRWPAVTTAAIYLAIMLGIIWTLQLFPAQPKLAPIFNPVTRMVPPPFPLLFIVPALAIDLLMRRVRGKDWQLAALIGVSYVVLMLAVHWFFSEFLMSPAARNFIFAADQWDYNVQLGDWRYNYWNSDRLNSASFLTDMAVTVLVAMVSARVGLWWGSGMARLQR